MSRAADSRIRVAITGACGYLGRSLCRRLAADPWIELVIGLDSAPWPEPDELVEGRFECYQQDVAATGLADRLVGLDAVCHLAFAIDSGVPDAEAHRVNLEGSHNLLRAVRSAGLRRVVVASSVSAYGALADNPTRLTERDPLRAGPAYRYAFHKVLVERMLDRFELSDPQVSVVRLRIATVLGPPPRPGAADDLLRAPVLALPPGFRVQFVHVDDVAEAFVAVLQERAQGAYNLAAEPPLSGRELCAVTGQRYLPVPRGLFGAGARLLAGAGLPDPGRLCYLAHPILVDCDRIGRELDFGPRHDSLACLRTLFTDRSVPS